MQIYATIALDEEVYLPKRRNSSGEPQTKLLTAGVKPDKLSVLSITNPFIIVILYHDFR